MISQDVIFWPASLFNIELLFFPALICWLLSGILWIVSVIQQIRNKKRRHILATTIALFGGVTPFFLDNNTQLLCDYIAIYFIVAIGVILLLRYPKKQDFDIIYVVPLMTVSSFWVLFTVGEMWASC